MVCRTKISSSNTTANVLLDAKQTDARAKRTKLRALHTAIHSRLKKAHSFKYFIQTTIGLHYKDEKQILIYDSLRLSPAKELKEKIARYIMSDDDVIEFVVIKNQRQGSRPDCVRMLKLCQVVAR